MKCVDFILAILYIVLVSLFLGGGLLHPVRGKKKTSQMGTLSEASGERNSVNQQKPDTIQSQVLNAQHYDIWSLSCCKMLIALLCVLLVLSDVTKYSTEKLGSAIDSTRTLGQLLRVLEISTFLHLALKEDSWHCCVICFQEVWDLGSKTPHSCFVFVSLCSSSPLCGSDPVQSWDTAW